MQTLQNCIGPTIRIGWEIRRLPYAGFLLSMHLCPKTIYSLLSLIPIVVWTHTGLTNIHFKGMNNPCLKGTGDIWSIWFTSRNLYKTAYGRRWISRSVRKVVPIQNNPITNTNTHSNRPSPCLLPHYAQPDDLQKPKNLHFSEGQF
mgnify:CR=1 FL=1